MRILILPGWEHTNREWKEVGKLLARDRHDVVVVDFPGMSNDMSSYNHWGVPEYAGWLTENYDVSHYDAVIAHSFGGRVITDVIARDGYAPKKLILTGTPLIHIERRGHLYKILAPILARILPVKIKNHVLSQINPDALAAKSHGNYESFKRVVNYDQRHQLTSIKSQVLLLWGQDDQSAPLDIGQYLADHISGAQLTVFKNVGHNIHLDKPLLLYGAITKFLSRD